MNDNIKIFQDALIRIQQGWCQGVMSCNSKGIYTRPNSRETTKWSLPGALIAGINRPVPTNIYWVNRKDILTDVNKAICQLKLEIPYTQALALWNDHPTRTQQQVIQVLERCIEMQKKGSSR